MVTLHFTSPAISNLPLTPAFLQNSKTHILSKLLYKPKSQKVRLIRAVGTATSESQAEAPSQAQEEELEPPTADFAFVSPVLLPDGTPDIHYRTACGGQKLRDIMLDQDIDLYGPYKKPLFNCGGGATCGSCIVEVVAGKEILNIRTEKEKEKLKKKPKNWRLACQTIVGKEDSRGQVFVHYRRVKTGRLTFLNFSMPMISLELFAGQSGAYASAWISP